MRVLVPFGGRDPKTRLSPVFDADERREFADAMLADVLTALSAHDPVVLANAPVETDHTVIRDQRPLTEAVNAALAEETPTAIVMADLPLVTSETIERLLAPDAGVTIAPGLGGGTNALVIRNDAFRVDYHGLSVRDHRTRARAAGADVATIDSFRLGIDIDEPAELPEVLLHSDGRAASWLHAHGEITRNADNRVSYRPNNMER